MPTYTITGRMTDQWGKPLSGLTVRAYGQDPLPPDDFLGEATTDADGRYRIRFSDAQRNPGGSAGGVTDLYVLVFDGERRLAESPVHRIEGERLSIDLAVDSSAGPAAETDQPASATSTVTGRLAASGGRPIAGALVLAFHKTLRFEQPLGKGITDDSGSFAITYGLPNEQQADAPNLLLRAFASTDGAQPPLAEAPVRFRAGRNERIDLIARPRQPQPDRLSYDRLVESLRPWIEGADPADLSSADIDFLAAQSGLAAADIDRLVLAERAARFSGLSAAGFHACLLAGARGAHPALGDGWARFLVDQRIDPEDAARFRFLALAGELVQFDPTLMKALAERLDRQELFGPLDLALWDRKRWQALLESVWSEEDAALPPWASGEALAERRAAAASTIERQADRVFPRRIRSDLLVSGRVLTPSQRPAASLSVQALHQDLGGPIAIGPRVRTDAAGAYRLLLDPLVLHERVPALDRQPLQLQLEVTDSTSTIPLASSEPKVAASLPLQLDITLAKELGPPEFARIAEGIERALGDIPLAAIDEDRSDWLAAASGLDPATTRRFLSAQRQASAAGLPAEVFYAHLHPALDPRPRGETLEARLRRAVTSGLASEGILDHLEALTSWETERRRETREREIASRIDALRQPPPAGQPARPVDMLRAVGIDPSALAAYIRRTAETPEAEPSELLRELQASGLARQLLLTMASALRLAELVGPEPELVASLLPALDAPADEAEIDQIDARLAPIARLGGDTWAERLRALHPEDPPERHERRGRAIERRFERLHPAEALLARLEERRGDDRFRPLLESQELLRRVDLHGRGLAFQARTDALDAVPEGIRAELDALQRLARIAPYRETLTLRTLGYDSVRAIAAAPGDGFVEAFLAAAPQGSAARAGQGEDAIRRQAKALHRRAKLQTGRALAAAGALSPAITAADPFVMHGGKSRASINLETLFGSLDACSVVPCESVLGTPAYLVDLLELLDTAAPDPAYPNPQKVLRLRRPDLSGIELSCANAETPLPQIDLTIELLEDATLGRAPRARQTSWSAGELLAHPEHVDADAYRKLNSDEAVFPWTLPFSLAQAEADLYLEDLGTNRAELMVSQRTAPQTQQQALEEASAELSLSPTARKALLGELHIHRPWRFWGHGGDTPPPGWPAVVWADVRLQLDRTGLSHADLLELLASGFVNPDRSVELVVADGADACDLSAASLIRLDAAFLDRLHRFTRLQWLLNCGVRELDHAVAVLGAGPIDADLLITLAAARRVAKRLKRPLAEVLPLWGDIDTRPSLDRSTEPLRRNPSQYERLVLDKGRLPTAERARLAVPFDAGVAASDVQAVAARAVGMDAASLALLTGSRADLALPEAVKPNDMAPLALVCALHRWQLLADTTGWSIADLRRLQGLTGIDPFATPADTAAFLAGLDALERHGISVEELDLILRHVGESASRERFEQQLLQQLQRLQRQLNRQGQHAGAFDATEVAELLAQQLARETGLSVDSIHALISHVDGTSGFDQPMANLLTSWLPGLPQEVPAWAVPEAWQAFGQLVKSARLLATWRLSAEAAPLCPDPLPMVADAPLEADQQRVLFDQWLALAAHAVASRQAAKPGLAERLGIAPEQLSRWAADALDPETSAEIRSVASIRAAEQPWSQRSPQLRHRLREQQRDALLAFVKQQQKALHLDALHSHYLLDLEMGPQPLTTRIALATAAVQSFVQRALLGHETAADGSPVVLSKEVAAHWEWMGSFERWRNARQRFLYPENFLTPEVRPGKTGFFAEFEQKLSQRSLTAEAIEDALGEYLEKLEDVARLEIMGTCVEQVDGSAVLHIVGRTRSLPHIHYHRRWYMDGGGFTPWEKLDLDIDGDWVVPMVFDGRLSLYWVKNSRQIEGMSDIVGLIPARPFPLAPHYPMFQDQYTLAWSRRERRGWSKQQVAERPIARPFNPLMPAQFAVRLDGQRLRIAGVTPLPQVPEAADLKPPSRSWPEPQPNQKCLTWPGSSLSPTGDDNGDADGKGGHSLLDLAKDPPKDPLTALPEILEELRTLPDKLNDALTEIPDLVWQSLSERIGELAGEAWQQLPADLRKIVCFLGDLIDKANRFLNPPGEISGRLIEQMVRGGMQFLAQIAQVFDQLIQWLTAKGLRVFFGAALIEQLERMLAELRKLFELSGMSFAVEFGYFDLRPGSARSVRLTPPSPEMLAAASAPLLPAALPAVPLLASSVGMALLPSLVALGESARLLYSMFPGYPAFHDLPLQTGILHTRLPLWSPGDVHADWRIKAWPGSGYLLLFDDPKQISSQDELSIGINLQQVVVEELRDVGQEASDLFSDFINDQGGARKTARAIRLSTRLSSSLALRPSCSRPSPIPPMTRLPRWA